MKKSHYLLLVLCLPIVTNWRRISENTFPLWLSLIVVTSRYVYRIDVVQWYPMIEGSLEVKFPTIWTDEKQRWEESGKRREEKKKEDQRRSKQRKSEERRSRCAQKGRKVAKHCFSNDLWLRMVESRLAKAAGAEPAGQMRDEKLHAVVGRSACPSQNARNTPSLEHFLKLRCGKSARVLAQSTFPSQNVQNTPGSKHFWQLRCRKSARRCGATRISKSKRTKPFMFGTLLEVQISISKKCAPLWRKAHFQVKMLKALHVRSTFGGWDVERVHAAVARRAFPS